MREEEGKTPRFFISKNDILISSGKYDTTS